MAIDYMAVKVYFLVSSKQNRIFQNRIDRVGESSLYRSYFLALSLNRPVCFVWKLVNMAQPLSGFISKQVFLIF